MKHWMSGIVIALALALVLAVGVAALAENAGEEPQLPEAGELQPAPEAQAPEAEDPQAETEQDAQQDATALQEALNALKDARQSAHEDDLQAELDGYVASGKLTQEQADTIMKFYKERESLRNGTCPGCGYQFGNGQGKGGRGNGFGGKGGNGFGGSDGSQRGNGFGGGKNGRGGKGMKGGFGDFQAQPSTPADPGQTQPNAFNEGI